MSLIHQLFLGDLLDAFARRIVLKTVPMGKAEKCSKGFRLLQGTLQHVKSHMQGSFVAVFARKLHIQFHPGFELLCRLHACRHCGIIYIAQR